MIDASQADEPDQLAAATGTVDAPGGGADAALRVGITPEQVIRSDADARIILGLWVIRKGWLPLLWIGLIVATLPVVLRGDDFDSLSARIAEIERGSGLLDALLTPLAIAATAVVMRIASLPLGWVAAFPLALREKHEHHPGSNRLGRLFRVWRDRMQLTRGYAALRWTWLVRYAAINRLTAHDTLLARSVPILRWTGIVSFVCYFVVSVIAIASVA